MRNISANMQALLASDAIPALATFWLLTRKDGISFGFTDWSEDVIYQGVTFRADGGTTRSAVQQRVDLSVPSFDISGILSSPEITDEDIRAGKYDNARIKSWMAVPTDANFGFYGTIPLPGAFLGEITIRDGVYTAEIRGLSYALQQSFVETYTPTCQADFGDSRCKLNLEPFRDGGRITSVASPNKVIAVALDSTNAAGRYTFGLITFTSGRNKGSSVEIRAWTGGTGTSGNLTLYLPSGMPLEIGDTFTVLPGCDKSFNPTTGQGCYQWNNTDNFRGFPFIPGVNFLLDYGIATA